MKWTIKPITVSADGQPPPKQLPQFVHIQHPSFRTKTTKTPLEIFQLFFANFILSFIVHLLHHKKGKVMKFCIEELMSECYYGDAASSTS